MSAKQGYESPGIAGAGRSPPALPRSRPRPRRHDPARPQRGFGLARRGESRRRLRQDRGRRAVAAAGHHRPQRPRRLRRRRRGDRRGGRGQGGAARDDRRGLPERRPGDHHLLARDRRDRRGRRHRQALRPPRLQPGAADEAGRGLLPRRRRPAPASGRWPGARRSARPRSRFPTRPASSSTGCSSPTSSTRCGWSSAPAWRRARSTPA